jgi:hypothetical protein
MLAGALRRPALLYMSCLGFMWMFCMAALFFWLPLLVSNIQSGTALSNSSMGHAVPQATHDGAAGAAAAQAAAASRRVTKALLASTLPYVGAAAATVLVSWLASAPKAAAVSSQAGDPKQQQQQQQRRHTKMFHVAVPLFLAAVPLMCFTPAYLANPSAGFAMLCLALTAGFSANSTMIAEASRMVPPSTAGVGLVVFNLSVAMGGLAGPAVVGLVVEVLGGFRWAVLMVGVVLAAAAAVAAARGVWELAGCGVGAAATEAATAEPVDVEAASHDKSEGAIRLVSIIAQ